MEWKRSDLKSRAWETLKSFYWSSVLAAFVLALVTGGFGGGGGGRADESVELSGNEIVDAIGGRFAGPIAFFFGMALLMIVVIMIAGLLLSIFVFNPLAVGCKKYFLDASDGSANLGNMGYSFKNGYMNVVSGMFLMDLFIVLWSLLLIIPGIVKAYEYRMIPYLLAEDSNLSFSEAKRLSSEMMAGEKWDAFVLDLSFILWKILSAITFGLVGIFWVNPYYQYTCVELYKVLRTKVQGPYYAGNAETFEV